MEPLYRKFQTRVLTSYRSVFSDYRKHFGVTIRIRALMHTENWRYMNGTENTVNRLYIGMIFMLNS